jgi:predicted nucleotide-binding protein (sugar kinase/HSP70/actin superfamily)
MFDAWGRFLGLSEEENARASRGFRELAPSSRHPRRAREVLDQLERENRIGIVLLAGRITTTRAEPRDPRGVPEARLPGVLAEHAADGPDMLERLFGEEVRAGRHPDPLEIQDVWKNSYSENTTRRCGRPSSPRGTRTWWRSSCRASSAATTRRSTR